MGMIKMNLFQRGDITLHSGGKSDFKIECDALTDEDVETLAYLISKKYKFNMVCGVAEGGLRLEEALRNIEKLKLEHPAYIVGIKRRPKLLINCIETKFVTKNTLPIPDYDQDVFKYDPKTGNLNYLWSLPDKDTLEYLVWNPQIPQEQQKLREFCLLFKKNILDKVYGR